MCAIVGGLVIGYVRGSFLACISSLTNLCMSIHQLFISVVLSLTMQRQKLHGATEGTEVRY